MAVTETPQDGAAPAVSVVLVTRNAARTVERALDSVRARPRPAVECIVVDGGSTDGTVGLVHDAAVDRYVSEPDGGLYDAMNKGVRMARGRWVLFLGADDALRDLGPAIPFLADEHTVYHGDVVLMPGGRRLPGRMGPYRLAVWNACQQSLLYPRRVLLHRPFSLRYPVLADHALNLELWGDPGIRFQRLHVTIAEHGVGGVSTRVADPAFEADKLRLVRASVPATVYGVVRARHLAVGVVRAAGLGGVLRRVGRAWRGR